MPILLRYQLCDTSYIALLEIVVPRAPERESCRRRISWKPLVKYVLSKSLIRRLEHKTLVFHSYHVANTFNMFSITYVYILAFASLPKWYTCINGFNSYMCICTYVCIYFWWTLSMLLPVFWYQYARFILSTNLKSLQHWGLCISNTKSIPWILFSLDFSPCWWVLQLA